MVLGSEHPGGLAASRPAPRAPRGLGAALGLGILAIIPLAVGTLRLVQVAGGPAVIPADPRFDAFPVAVVLHITGSAVFVVLGILQFLPRFRRAHRTWHRGAGRVLIGAGLAVTGSALWLTVAYDPQPGTGPLLFGARVVFIVAMAVSLLRGVTAIRERDIPNHRAWMMRAYAIALGAGTQVVTEGIGGAALGPGVLVGDLAKGAGWVINLVIAEWLIRRSAPTRVTRGGAR